MEPFVLQNFEHIILEQWVVAVVSLTGLIQANQSSLEPNLLSKFNIQIWKDSDL